MKNALHYAFIDESGNTATSRQNHILVVAAITTDNPHTIARLIRKTQKKYGSSLASSELKAKKAKDSLTVNLLNILGQEPIGIFSVIIDRHIIEHPLEDPEELYRWAVTRLVVRLVIGAQIDSILSSRRLRRSRNGSFKECVLPLCVGDGTTS